jgi:hypothetical protein
MVESQSDNNGITGKPTGNGNGNRNGNGNNNGKNQRYYGFLQGAPGVGGPGHAARIPGTAAESQTDAGYCFK